MINYQFQILRYLPDRVSGEFVNLGVVVYDENTKQFASRFADRVSRVSAFFPGVNVRNLHRVIRFLHSEFSKLAPKILTEFYFEKNTLELITSRILPKDDSSLIFSEIRIGRDVNLNAALDELFDRLVTGYLEEDEREIHNDKEVWQKIYKKYFEEVNLADKFHQYKIKTENDELEFEHSIRNGVMNCFESITFDLSREDNIKNKVYKWDGRINELRTSKEPVHLYLMVQYPQKHPALSEFINRKLDHIKFNGSSVEIVTESNARQTAIDLMKAVDSHS